MAYCERCGGELGNGCDGTGSTDCDLNLELKADGVSPDHYRNQVPPYVMDVGERAGVTVTWWWQR